MTALSWARWTVPAALTLARARLCMRTGGCAILDEGGGQFTAATAINDHGQVAGVFEEDEEDEHPAAKKGKVK